MTVDLIAQFWHNHEAIEVEDTLTHPLITYADLIATADIRNIETAQLIRVNQLEKLIQELTNED